MSIATTDRFKTAAEYIAAHNNPLITPEIAEALESILVKRNGVWSVRVTAPKYARGAMRPRLAWEAYRVAKYATSWGTLGNWGEGLTAMLMFANEDDREYFNKVFDQFIEIGKVAKAAKAAKAKAARRAR